MEFIVFSSPNIAFSFMPCAFKSTKAKSAILDVDKLKRLRSDMSTPLNLASKLNRLLAERLPGTKTKNLENQMGCKLRVALYYTTRTSTGETNAWWKIEDAWSRVGLLRRLVSVFGSLKNITANFDLEMEDKVKLSFKDVKFSSDWSSLAENFNLSEMLVRKWGRLNTLTGRIGLTLKLNQQALSQMYTGILTVGEPLTKKFLEDSENSGDVVIEVENGVQVKCHKIFLGQCEAFRAMLNTEMQMQEEKNIHVIMSDITEHSLKALLSYFYYRDITEALWSSSVAVELLKASDKYRIQNLYKFMKNLVLEMENKSFSVASAVQLLTLLVNRNENDDADLKNIEEKAKTILKLKSDDELDECEQFRKFFNNPDIGLNMFFFLRETK